MIRLFAHTVHLPSGKTVAATSIDSYRASLYTAGLATGQLFISLRNDYGKMIALHVR